MLIVADENMPLLEEFFGDLGEIRRVPGRSLRAADLAGADLLLVRSVTRVDAALLAQASPRFVGSATIGTDHVDLDLLAARGIPFASAPGCNAVAVAEYVTTVLALHAAERGGAAANLRLGVIGCGNVGRTVVPCARALGHEVAVCDPLLEAGALPAGCAAMSLDELLAWADVLTLHVPLTRGGQHPTHHLLDQARLRAGRWQLLINTSRGAVVDNRALSQLLEEDASRRAVLDVWEEEPAVPPGLLRRVRWGTPHVAGYSVEGKWRGTAMIYEAACRRLGITPRTNLAAVRAARGDRPESLRWVGSLAATLAAACDVPGDDGRLRAVVSEDRAATASAFDRLRREYRERREFSHYRLVGLPPEPGTRERNAVAQTKTPRAVLAALGFGVAP
ncbi:MAG: 4-phosphoerythronate dehydrogenase [Gammaproteobacteria bacterium]